MGSGSGIGASTIPTTAAPFIGGGFSRKGMEGYFVLEPKRPKERLLELGGYWAPEENVGGR